MVKRRPVAPPEITSKPEGAAIAGWEQLTVELAAVGRGMRHLLVVLEPSQPSAADAQALKTLVAEILRRSIIHVRGSE